MLIEFVEDKREKTYVIQSQSGCTMLSHCVLCGKEMRDERNYRAICDVCGKLRTLAERTKIWRDVLLRYPELEEKLR